MKLKTKKVIAREGLKFIYFMVISMVVFYFIISVIYSCNETKITETRDKLLEKNSKDFKDRKIKPLEYKQYCGGINSQYNSAIHRENRLFKHRLKMIALGAVCIYFVYLFGKFISWSNKTLKTKEE